MNLRHQRAGLRIDGHLVETGPPALFHLSGFSEETRPRGDGSHEADRHAQGDGRLAVGIAGRAEGDVSDGKDNAAMRKTLEVDHVRLEPQTEAAVAPPDFQVLDPQGPCPGVVLHPSRDLARNRLSGRAAHWMVAVRMKLDSLVDCCSR